MSILQRTIFHDRATQCSLISYPRFVLPRHKHVEIELMLFTGGCGKQFIGEGVADYAAGDVALIGSNVPHLHLCQSVLTPDKGLPASSGLALQFSPALFPTPPEALPDYQAIHQLLKQSQYGLRFYEKGLFSNLQEAVTALNEAQGTRRLITLLEILDRLCHCKNVKLLSETAYNSAHITTGHNDPISKVYDYLYNHFKEKVTLTAVAEAIRQNPSALCRYFKQRTDKTIFGCLAEIRVEHACRLLSCSHLTVSQIAYESGYNNVPFFIAQFQKLTKRTPNEYRRQIVEMR